MHNIEVRDAIQRARLKHYEVAAELGMSEYTFSRLLRTELPDAKKQAIYLAIETILAGGK